MSEYYPDSWVVLKIQYQDNIIYKLLAGLSGGYTQGDSWRLNSGITKVTENGNFLEFWGYSGSCYVCHKDAYRLTMANALVYNKLNENFGVEMMPEDTDWMNMEWFDYDNG